MDEKLYRRNKNFQVIIVAAIPTCFSCFFILIYGIILFCGTNCVQTKGRKSSLSSLSSADKYITTLTLLKRNEDGGSLNSFCVVFPSFKRRFTFNVSWGWRRKNDAAASQHCIQCYHHRNLASSFFVFADFHVHCCRKSLKQKVIKVNDNFYRF